MPTKREKENAVARTARSKELKEKDGTLRRLVVANLVAGLLLLTVTVVSLWALGLLPSVLKTFF